MTIALIICIIGAICFIIASAGADRHGADHIGLANAPYTEENRTRPPYDVWVWFNATLYHGPPHPLLPRYDSFAAMEAENKAPEPSILVWPRVEPKVFIVRNERAIIHAVK